jgi:predicted aldo/keto reductase-like oxidoreductase
MMQYRKMGSLDWQVSALGFGCMRLPSRKFSLMGADLKESRRIIRYGIDRGINYIDTAWFYHLGESEKILGETLKDGYREKVKLVTKLPMPIVRNSADFDRYLESQLKRLQTDYLDIYLFHSMNAGEFAKMKKLGLLEKMEDAKRQGLIGHIGFSFHDTLPVFKEMVDYYPWDVVQIQYNYMDTGIQATTDGLKYAADKGMAVVIMEPVKGGTLANPPAEARQVMESAPVRRSPVDWALQFLWNSPEVSTVLSGMSNFQQVIENCDSADRSGVNTLSPQEEQVIGRLAEIYREKLLVPCTGCAYCLPCPEGVNIPQNFAILNNLSLESNLRRRLLVRWSYRKLAGPGQVNLESSSGKASLCTNCGHCLPLCPQEINIPLELEKVMAVLERRENIQQFIDSPDSRC